MLIIYTFAALYGAALTVASLYSPLGLLPSLAAAPFGGSLTVILAALVLFWPPSSWQRLFTRPRRLRPFLKLHRPTLSEA
jgi:hypothetical protein